MKIELKVKINSDKNIIDIDENGNYCAYLSCQPINGKANTRLIKLLSKYFKVSKSQISIIKGKKCKNKIINIEENI